MISTLLRAGIGIALFCLAAHTAGAQSAASPGQNGATQKPAARTAAKPARESAAKAAPQPQTAQKTIGLISLIGEGFTVKKVGIMVFGNEEKTFPVEAWKIDDRVTALVASLVKKNFKVKRIVVPAGSLKAFNSGSFFLKSYEDEFAKFIAPYTKDQACDYYLVVSNAHTALGSSNQSLGGLGVVRWDSIIGPHEYVYALSFLNVYDAHMKSLRGEVASTGQDLFLTPIKGPHVKLDDDKLLPEDANAVMGDPRTKQLVLDLLDKSLTVSVPKLFAAN